MMFSRLHHESDPQFTYLRFNLSEWGRTIKSPYKKCEFLEFFVPVWSFIKEHLERGENVLVHCLAGAHRAGTLGVCFLLHQFFLSFQERGCQGYVPTLADTLKAAQSCRPIINPVSV